MLEIANNVCFAVSDCCNASESRVGSAAYISTASGKISSQM